MVVETQDTTRSPSWQANPRRMVPDAFSHLLRKLAEHAMIPIATTPEVWDMREYLSGLAGLRRSDDLSAYVMWSCVLAGNVHPH